MDEHTPEQCATCGESSGSVRYEGDVPLGELVTCPLCRLRVCPVCLHEAECCFREEDWHLDDSQWAPPGWRLVLDEGGRPIHWERTGPGSPMEEAS